MSNGISTIASIDSPWALLLAHLANDEKSLKKVGRIKEYLSLRRQRDEKNPAFDETARERLQSLKQEISGAYFIRPDFTEYLPGGAHADAPGATDFAERFHKLKSYLTTILDEAKTDPQSAVRSAVSRAIESAKRRTGYVQELVHAVKTRQLDLNEAPISQQTLVDFLSTMFPKAGSNASRKLAQAIDFGNAILSGEQESTEWVREFIDGLETILEFLEDPYEREDLTLIDLTFYLGEHRGASLFRGSTSAYYSALDSFFAGLVHQFPGYEKDRWGVDSVHSLVDPQWQNLVYSLKLSAINAKHGFGFSPEMLDIYGAVTGMISSVMRAFGIDEIDDRFKQYLHNTGDHSVRTLITIAQTRDTIVNRLQFIQKRHNPFQEGELQELILSVRESAKFRAEWALLHDAGEFLGELLGNNLVGKNKTERKELKKLRDMIEDHIAANPVLQELRTRLTLSFSSRPCQDERIDAHIRHLEEITGLSSSKVRDDGKNAPASGPDTAYDYRNPYDLDIATIFERLNSTHDVITQRFVGRIRPDGSWQNQRNLDEPQFQYTLLYVISKIIGHKAETTDPVDVARHHEEMYQLQLERDGQKRSDQLAIEADAPRQYRKRLSRVRSLPNTALPIETYLLERDIDYTNSLFRKFVVQTLKNHERLKPHEACLRQIHDEAHLYAVFHEALHYAKKVSRMSPRHDAEKVEQALRKSFAEGVAAAAQELEEQGLSLRYLKVASYNAFLRYRPGTMNYEKLAFGAFSDSKKPNQFLDLQAPVQWASPVLKSAGAIAGLAYNVVNTIPAALMRWDLNTIKLEEFQALYKMTSVLEAGADAGLTGTGLIQSHRSLFTDFVGNPGLMVHLDTKSLAFINPWITFLLQQPHIEREAIEKSYGHVLAGYSSKIAGKYGLSPKVLALILKRRNLGKGEFDRNPYDPLPSGHLAEQLHDYFLEQYNGGPTNGERRHIGPWDNKFIKMAERAERTFLHETIKNEIRRIRERSETTCDPAERIKYLDSLKSLKEAAKTLGPWRKNSFYTLASRYGMPIRFGSIGVFGLLMSFSGAGGEITLPWIGTVKSTLFFGANLAFAGLSAFLSSIREMFKNKVGGANAFVRLLRNLPHFAYDRQRGLYVVKGSHHSPHTSRRHIRRIIDGDVRNPGFFRQAADCALACVATPVRALSSEKVSSDAFARQHTATFIDSSSLMLRAFSSGGADLTACAQGFANMTAMALFMRVSLYNMMMFEIQSDLRNGNLPHLDTIKTRIGERLKEKTSVPLLNFMKNASALTQRTALGRKTASVLERFLPGNILAGMTIHYAKWRTRKNSRLLKEATT